MGFNSISRRGTVTEPEDLYEVLQVHPSAHPEVIQAAYRRLVILHHPDQNPSAEATQVMARINHAFEVLNDPDKRAEYDRGRQPSDAAPAPRRRSGTSALDYITIGSRKEDVARIQGPPDSITPPELAAGEEWWHYTGVGVYSLDKAGRVVDWSNFGGGLKIGMVPGPTLRRLISSPSSTTPPFPATAPCWNGRGSKVPAISPSWAAKRRWMNS